MDKLQEKYMEDRMKKPSSQAVAHTEKEPKRNSWDSAERAERLRAVYGEARVPAHAPRK